MKNLLVLSVIFIVTLISTNAVAWDQSDEDLAQMIRNYENQQYQDDMEQSLASFRQELESDGYL